jgi:predicted nucleotidyltransferase
MSLSKRHIDTGSNPISFDFYRMSAAFANDVPDAVFAYLHGSTAESCVVPPHGDIDIAVFLSPNGDRENTFTKILDICEKIVPGVRCDIGFLNNADPIYRYEVLKGRLLICRDQELWLRFYSLACREYETQLFHYEKQHRYRIEARG